MCVCCFFVLTTVFSSFAAVINVLENVPLFVYAMDLTRALLYEPVPATIDDDADVGTFSDPHSRRARRQRAEREGHRGGFVSFIPGKFIMRCLQVS